MTAVMSHVAAHHEAAHTFDRDEVVVLDIGGQALALPIGSVVAVLDPQQMTVADDDGHRWIGWLATRTGSIPVADGRAVFGGSSPTPHGKLIVLRGDPLVALAVDGLLATVRPRTAEIFDFPELCGTPETLLMDAALWNNDDLIPRIAPAELHRMLTRSNGSRHFDEEAHPLSAKLSTEIDGFRGQALLVEIDGEQYALPVRWVRQISAGCRPVPLPRAHPALHGLVSWERAPVAVIDLKRRRAGVADSIADGMLVVIGAPPEVGEPLSPPLAALAVDTVVGVVEVQEWRTSAVVLDDGRQVRPFDAAGTSGAFP